MVKPVTAPRILSSSHSNSSGITKWLKTANPVWFTIYVSLSAFCLYTCIYAYRKTFAAATFQDQIVWGMSYKMWLVIFQVVGYALSKFVGIKIISELKHHQRAKGILITSAIALLSWLFFAIVPSPYNITFLFVNGIALGLVWGMVFSYLEGRRVTEVLGAVLSVSFIFSSGLCRSVGSYLLITFNVSETWMPFVAGALFTIPLIVFLFLLDKVPPPSTEDVLLRTKRQPMNKSDRRLFVTAFLPGIILFVVGYMLLTAFRDFRDNFSAEVWASLGYAANSDIYTKTEVPISLGVLVVMGSIMLIRNNKAALMINHVIIIAGMVLIGVSTYLFENKIIDPATWMILIGFGLYLGYVPFNSIFFDRMIAAFQFTGTVGFIMYVADAFGYLGSVGVLLFKQFGTKDVSWLSFFVSSGYLISVAGGILITASMAYFYFKSKTAPSTTPV
jgi:hypothetical protein